MTVRCFVGVFFAALAGAASANAANLDGGIDPTFGTNGSNVAAVDVIDMKATASGEILVLRDGRIDKLDAQGLTIASLPTHSLMSAVAPMPDGGFVLAGIGSDPSMGRTLELCRYDKDVMPGDWSDDGCVTLTFPIPFPGSCWITAAVATGATQIVVGGMCPNSFLLAFAFDGASDTRFSGGNAVQNIFGEGDELTSLASDPNGTIWVGGSARIVHDNVNGSFSQDFDFAVASLSPFGQLNPAFAYTGVRTIGFLDASSLNSNDRLVSLSVEPQRLILVGYSGEQSFTPEAPHSIKRLVALKRNGARDLTFGMGTGISSVTQPFALQTASGDGASGYFLVGATFRPFGSTCTALHVERDGALDTAYGGGEGYTAFSFPGGPFYVTCARSIVQGNRPVIAQSDGLAIGGSAIGRLSMDAIFADAFETSFGH